MYRLTLMVVIVVSCCFSLPAVAREFAVDDFDPPDPGQATMYEEALADLIENLTIVATDDEGNEIFRAVPFPMELVALMAQTDIHAGDVTDPEGLYAIVDAANSNKPAPNSFAFVLDGDPEWVSGDVSMFYFLSEEDMEGYSLDVFQVSEPENIEDGVMVSEWAVVAYDAAELMAFLGAADVTLVVSPGGDSVEPISLDCGFWRMWGLFDLRGEEGEEVPTNPEASE